MQKNVSVKTPVRPYPKQWERKQTLANGRALFLRPIRQDDEGILNAFIQKCDPEDVRQRLFHAVRKLPHETAVIFTQIDYDYAMVFVALDEKSGEFLGIAHLITDPDCARAEYAILTRSDVKKQGIGSALTKLLIEYARKKGVGELWGQIMRDNTAMLKICENFGIQVVTDKSDPIYLVASLFLHNKTA